MKVKSLLIFCLLAVVECAGCTPSATAPTLPPMTTAPIESQAQAAIINSSIIDQDAAASKPAN